MEEAQAWESRSGVGCSAAGKGRGVQLFAEASARAMLSSTWYHQPLISQGFTLNFRKGTGRVHPRWEDDVIRKAFN